MALNGSSFVQEESRLLGCHRIAHCMSIKTAFAMCRMLTAELPYLRPEFRRALNRRVRTLKIRKSQAEVDHLAMLKARHDNYMDSLAADLGLRIFRAA